MEEVPIVGGSLDGQTSRPIPTRVPVITEEYSRAYSAWSERYGVAWTIENLDHLVREPVTPPPPPMPSEWYELRYDDGRCWLEFTGVAP